MANQHKRKAARSDFALSGGRFPLNTPGRARVAAKDAKASLEKGHISRAQYATIRRKAAAARARFGIGHTSKRSGRRSSRR